MCGSLRPTWTAIASVAGTHHVLSTLSFPTFSCAGYGHGALDAATRDGLLADLALDVLVPPLSTIAVSALLGFVAASARLCFAPPSHLATIAFAAWSTTIGMLLFYVARGWSMSRTGLGGLAALAWAPVFVAWKIGLAIRGRAGKTAGWVRTSREARTP